MTASKHIMYIYRGKLNFNELARKRRHRCCIPPRVSHRRPCLLRLAMDQDDEGVEKQNCFYSGTVDALTVTDPKKIGFNTTRSTRLMACSLMATRNLVLPFASAPTRVLRLNFISFMRPRRSSKLALQTLSDPSHTPHLHGQAHELGQVRRK